MKHWSEIRSKVESAASTTKKIWNIKCKMSFSEEVYYNWMSTQSTKLISSMVTLQHQIVCLPANLAVKVFLINMFLILNINNLHLNISLISNLIQTHISQSLLEITVNIQILNWMNKTIKKEKFQIEYKIWSKMKTVWHFWIRLLKKDLHIVNISWMKD